MADTTNNSEASKKSGFSFRKKRSTSKTRKEEPEMKPVDHAVVHSDGEIMAAGGSEVTPSKDETATTSDVEAVSCGEESSLVKADEEQSPEGTEETKKKSKRRSRSLFKSRKRSKVEKSVERNKDDGAVKGVKNDEAAPEAASTGEVEAPAHSDVEYGGDASETDGEFARDEDDDEDDEDGGRTSGNETNDETKKVTKTKKKSFFKRGLSLRRSKGKKKSTNEEQHVENPTTTSDNPEKPSTTTDNPEKPPTTILKPESISFATQTTTEENADGKDVGESLTKDCDENKAPIKPARKVSFAQKNYESSDGDSPVTEENPATGNNSQDAAVETETTPTGTEDAATKTEDAATETEAVPATADVDDDDLTEVSSVTSSVVISVLDIEEPAEETGSRITLEESGEVGERSGEQEVIAEPEDAASAEKESTEGEKPLEEVSLVEGSTEESFKDAQSEKNTLEDDKLLSEETTKTKDADWLLQQSCDMSHEISRVRKQTLFSVKRLCCSVM